MLLLEGCGRSEADERNGPGKKGWNCGRRY